MRRARNTRGVRAGSLFDPAPELPCTPEYTPDARKNAARRSRQDRFESTLTAKGGCTMPKIPAGMRKTARGLYESRFTVDGKRYSVYGKTVRECREKENARRLALREKQNGAENKLTLDQYFLRWEQARLGSVRESTIRTERYIYRLVSSLPIGGAPLGEISLCALEGQQLRDAQTLLRQTYSSATVNRAMSVVKAVLESAVIERLISWNPSRGVRILKDGKKPPRETIHRALTLEETAAFFRAAAARGSWYIPLYEFLLNTGCRFGEAGALMPGDISDGLIHIARTLTKNLDGRVVIGRETKTGHSVRVIPARQAALEAIRAQQRQNAECFGEDADTGANAPIFRAPRGGLLGARCVATDIDRICRDAGIERFAAHAFRDTFATRAVESGMQAKTLQEILGHADIGITMNLYAHVMEDTKRRQMAAVKVLPQG